VADCAYCSHPAYNVIEVRYTRSVAGAGGIREVLGRGYSVCDGCLALLDFHPEHHIDTERISLFNLAASVYQALGVWSVVALSALASISNAPETNLLNCVTSANGRASVLIRSGPRTPWLDSRTCARGTTQS
jgi:hypothetical protein